MLRFWRRSHLLQNGIYTGKPVSSLGLLSSESENVPMLCSQIDVQMSCSSATSRL